MILAPIAEAKRKQPGTFYTDAVTDAAAINGSQSGVESAIPGKNSCSFFPCQFPAR
jgi:hypothetical protein